MKNDKITKRNRLMPNNLIHFLHIPGVLSTPCIVLGVVISMGQENLAFILGSFAVLGVVLEGFRAWWSKRTPQ